MALILIADDSPTEVFILKKISEKHQHQIIIAEDGNQAIALTHSKKPHLIVMDVIMPNLNGFQTTRHLSKDPKTSDIPIVIVSSKDQESDKLWGLRQGAKGYLGKPITEALLMAEVNKLLGLAA
ncbi:MAG: response regulator [Piscirickettsiaceae bacterium]|nr:response regulator [Piscirickettsiaceae bacterium]